MTRLTASRPPGPEEVLDLLTGRFPALADEPDRGVVLRAVAAQLACPVPQFEVILDHPSAANWRLKQDPADPGRFRVADCRMFGTAPDAAVDRINEVLAGS